MFFARSSRIAPRLGKICIIVSLFIFIHNFCFSVSDSDIKVFFSPQDNCAAEVLKRLNSAKESIDIAMYYFTSRPLAQALVNAKNRNVNVRVFLDGNQRTERFSKTNYLTNEGISVKIKNSTAGLMHNKFCIIDKRTVITGSFNWTTAADLKNDENLVIVESAKIAGFFAEQFEKLWNNQVPEEMQYKDTNRLEKIIKD